MMDIPLASTCESAPATALFLAPRVAAEPARATVGELLMLMGVASADAQEAPAIPLPLRALRAGETLFHEGARAESLFFVRSGTLKLLRTAQDGYEQVLGFAGRADVLGLDAMRSDRHSTEAVALEDGCVYALPMRGLLAIAERCRAFGEVVHLAMSDALERQGESADVMAPVAAEVRLARFLLHLSRRMAGRGQSPSRFVLRMSRRDIASYLGVAHETVSRAFTALAGWGLVEVDNRKVSIADMAGLRALSLGTRRQIDGASRRGITSPVAPPAA